MRNGTPVRRPDGPLLLSLGVVSAAVLAYEVALVHLFTITHWTHFASLVISLALLGFAASGSAVALARRWTDVGRDETALLVALALAALAFDPAYRVAAEIPFDAFELIAVPRQFLYLVLTYLVLGVPFLFAGTAITLAFVIGEDRMGRVYAANLAGSGVGAFLGLALIAVLPAGRLPAAAGLIAAAALVPLAVRKGVARPTRTVATAVPALVVLLAWLAPPPRVPMSQYKAESTALELPDARVVARREGPLGRLDVVASPSLRYLPGTSLTLEEPLPTRPILYRAGEPLGPRTVAADTTLLARTVHAAAFAVRRDSEPDVLILGLGGGSDVWLARAAGADTITVVDPDPRIDRLLDPKTLGPDVERVVRSPRGYLNATRDRHDVIVVTGMGSLAGGAAGMAAAGASYLFTVQGLTAMLAALDDDGLLSITRWAHDPPREIPRLLATVDRVLADEGLEAGPRVALLRSWGTATLLVSRRPFAAGEVAALRSWAEVRQFDLTWAPGAPEAEANRFNILEPDWFRAAAEGLFGPDPERFVEHYPFSIAPVSDESPFFHHFLPLGRLVRLVRAEGRMSLPYVEWGTIAHALVVAQAIPIAAVLVLVPLFALPRARTPRGWLFLYFALLGFGFMLIEVTTIERLVLLLDQPIYATTVALAAFLLFAGLGSLASRRVAGRLPGWMPFAAIAVLAPLTYGLELLVWERLAGAALGVRVGLAVALLAPLAFAMGMPFPIGLQRVADRRPRWIPWCWGVNGFLSVIGAAAAPLVALGSGFAGSLMIAVGLYLVAGLTLARL